MNKKRSYEPERRLIQRNLRIDKQLRLPLPQRYETTLECNVQGVIPAGNNSTIGLGTGFQIYPVKFNDLHLPFSTGNFNDANRFVLAAGSSGITPFTLAPAGYGNFMQSTGRGFYQYSRVLGSKISCTLLPGSASDTVSMVIVPIDNSAGSLPGSIVSASSMPFSKGPIMCTLYNDVKQNRLTSYASTASIYGVPPQAIRVEDGYEQKVNADPANVLKWYIMIQTNDSATNGAQIIMNVRIKYYVMFESSTQAGLLDTEA